MHYQIRDDQHTCAYMQLYEQLRRDIVEQNYKYGARLPSKRLLAEESGVSVVTAEHAYALLCDEGYVEARERRGYFVIYRKSDFLSKGESGAAPPLPAHAAHSAKDEFPFSVLARTMRRVLQDYGARILVKSPNHGCPELRQALCAYLARSSGIAVKPAQIIIGSGAEYLYSQIAQLLGTARPFALESPSYDKIRRVYQACGVQCEMLKLARDGIRSEELERSRAGVLHVTPFNSYPSGITASASKRAAYLHWAQSTGGFIVEDNYDSELSISTKAEDTLFSLDACGRVIYMNTFSQTIAPSMRAGYMVLPETLLAAFEEKLGFYACTVPVFEQYVLAALLNSGDFERHIHRVRRARRKAKKQASGHLVI